MEPLNREERQALMSLLELPTEAYGDWGLMTHKYRKAAVRFHPDKGGDPEKMSLLNCYMSRMQLDVEGSQTSSMVSVFLNLDFDFYTLGEWLGPNSSVKLCRDLLWCPKKKGCKCCMCILARKHETQKRENPGIMWNKCVCFKCYMTWFGHPRNKAVIEAWKKCIFNYPLKLTGLQRYIF